MGVRGMSVAFTVNGHRGVNYACKAMLQIFFGSMNTVLFPENM